MDSIDEDYLAWLHSLGVGIEWATPLEGDVSPRRYFRVHPNAGEPVILVAYPQSEDDAFRRFLITTRLFESARIRVPEIRASNSRLGLMLLEDVGPASLFDRTTGPWNKVRGYIENALEDLGALAARTVGPFRDLNPLLDSHRLARELRDARSVFLDRDDFSGDRGTRSALHSVLDRLTDSLAIDPLVPSHRDFMSRNLMLPPDGSKAAVIDHQDACLAPRFYDVASLLNDSFFPTPAQEKECLDTLSADREQLESYRRCAVQRTLKATATYIKFALRGYERHVPLIGPTLSRAALQLEQLPEGKAVPDALYALWRDPAAISRGLDRLLERSRTEAPEA